MTPTGPVRSALFVAAAVLTMTATACTAGEPDGAAGPSRPVPSAATDVQASGQPDVGQSDAGQSAAGPSDAGPSDGGRPRAGSFGPGCAALATAGAGGVAALTDEPVAAAAGDLPELSSLVDAVTAADLVDSLNSQEDVTVLAPANSAFEAVPGDVLAQVLADSARLTAVLTHHVIDGRLGPDELAGEQTTLNGDTVTIEATGDTFTVPAEGTLAGQAPATVICGNVQTANATVYLIDQVLAPSK